jgi:hypothetical protein
VVAGADVIGGMPVVPLLPDKKISIARDNISHLW